MADIVIWPHELLVPSESKAIINPFSRSGGASLGGVTRSIRTDLGWWTIELIDVSLRTREQHRTYDAISQALGGRSGLVAVPAWSIDTAPYTSGCYEEPVSTPHSDDSLFDDDTPYEQGAISAVSVGITPIGATTISIRLISGAKDLSGVRFSYGHALYQTGRVISVSDDIWTLKISPSVRATIPPAADLEFDMPTCLCHLVDDMGMGRSGNGVQVSTAVVEFVEATDYWNDLAAGLVE